MLKDKIRGIDIKAICIISLCYIPAFIYRLFNRDIWLCSERKDEARDNGYWMYKYIRENHPEQKCYYVISKDSFDRKKIEKYKTLINWGSLRHYFIFIATRIRLSAHVNADTANFRVTNFLERHHVLFNKRVFLQHGITKDKISFGYYNVSRANLFICAGIQEYEFCRKEFGYPEGNVVLTGFARFDGLKDVSQKENIICIIPTWRSWLNNVSEEQFKESSYYKTYFSLLNSHSFVELLKMHDLKVVFYLHPEMQKYSHLFSGFEDCVVVATQTDCDIQELLCKSKLLITDYSSVAFDFAYLKKPVIYYQFDYENYRSCQHPVGYFDYKNDGFGKIVHDVKMLLYELADCTKKDYVVDSGFFEKTLYFFHFFDQDNCYRIYNEIKRL